MSSFASGVSQGQRMLRGAIVAVGLCVPGATAIAGEALQNGGFDTGDLSGWYFQAQAGGQGNAAAVTLPRHDGTHSAQVTISVGDATNFWHIQLGQAGVPLTAGLAHRITFWARASASRQGELAIQQGVAPYGDFYVVDFALTTTWQKFSFSFTPTTSVNNALFNFNLAQATGKVWVDTVSVIPVVTTLRGPALTVNAGADRHPISPDIFGMNFTDPAIGDALGITVDRWGGDSVETYNWQKGSVNLASNYFYENVADCRNFNVDCSAGNVPFYRTFIQRDLARGRKPLITLPLMGYVAKDAPIAHPYTCSFPRTSFPDQQSFDPYDPNCGNGVSSSGMPLTTSPLTAGRATVAAYAGSWVADLVTRFGAAQAGGVTLYELGNEPGLWNSTHPDLHARALSYDELLRRSIDTAIAVKQQDPGARVLAFSEWGWLNYFCSAADDPLTLGCTATSPDRAAHGGIPLVEWLLQQFRNHEESTGTRIVDYVDVHYYPYREYSADETRSLWDATYTSPNYINDVIRLIPRMHEWVANDYPGTRLALTEYNFSIYGQPRLNAIVQADALGIFARESLDLATRWSLRADGSGAALEGIYDAFRVYRNYDGAGAHFGDTYVRSTSGNQGKLAVYAAQRIGDGALTIVVLNKTPNILNSTLTLNGATPTGAAQVWRWEGAGIVRQADRVLDAAATGYPPLSMTLYVVPLQ